MDNGALRRCNCIPLREDYIDTISDSELHRLGYNYQQVRHAAAGRYRSGMCSTCIDQFDILSLFILGKVSPEELKQIPSYSGNEFMKHMLKAQEVYSQALRGEQS